MRRLVESPGPTVALGLLITAGALWPASRLSIETDPIALMPSGSEAAEDYRVLLERFGGFEKVFVMVTATAGSDLGQAELVEAADRLVDALADSPEVAGVRSGLAEEDLDFVRRYVARRAPLLLGEGWRSNVERRITPDAIRRRAARIRRGASGPPGSPANLLLAADPFGFGEELPALRLRPSGLPVDPMTGAFLASDATASLVLLTPTRREVDPEGGRALNAELSRAYGEVRSALGSGLAFMAVGGPLYAAEDEALIKRDVRTSLVVSAIGCLALLIAAFGGAVLPLVALTAVALGLIWTAAGLELSLGEVTATGIGFSAVLLGLGIDYGIHGATRFRQRLLAGDDPRDGLAEALAESAPGILTSALTTAGAFAVLALAHFRPLRELGWMVGLGILSILATSAFVGGPLALLTSGRKGAEEPRRLWVWLGEMVDRLTRLAARRPVGVLGVMTLTTVTAIWGVTRLSLDPDLRVFRSTEHSALAAEPLLLERFGVGLETITVVVSDPQLDGALEKAASIARMVVESGGPAVTVSSPADWLIADQAVEMRLAELRELPLGSAVDLLREELARVGVDPAYFRDGLAAVRSLARGVDPGAPPSDAWPEWLGELVRSGEESFAALRIRAPAGRWPAGPPEELVRSIRAAEGRVASASLVGGELRRFAAADLRALGGVAFGLVALILVISFRGSLRHSALALVPVLLGGVWSLGLWGAAGRSLDLVTLAVLPIILGIGLDDGLHALHALRRQPERGVVAALGEAGRAMVLTTATTCVAFGSLAATTIPGLRNAGILVTAGVIGCLTATLVALPALEALGARRQGA